MDFWHVSHGEWFDVLDEASKRILNEHAVERHLAKHEQIFSPSPAPNFAYLLLNGVVSLYRLTRNGDQLTVGFVQPGQLFGALPILGNLDRETFATAMEDCTVLRIPKPTLLKIIKQCQPGALFITKMIAEDSVRIQRRLETLVFKSVRGRLASVLIELIEDFGQPDGKAVRVLLHLTQTELAQLVGASRPSINIALNEFQKDGALKIERGEFTVLHPDYLREVAEFDLPRNERRKA